jgi:hypothetical protein
MCIINAITLSVLINVNLLEQKKTRSLGILYKQVCTVHACVKISSLGVDTGIPCSPLVFIL